MSVAFLSLSGKFKKSAKRRQAVKLKTRSMRTTELDKCVAPLRNFSEDTSGQSSQERGHDTTDGLLLKEQNDSTVVNDQKVDANPRIKLKFNDTKWTNFLYIFFGHFLTFFVSKISKTLTFF